MKRHDSEPEYRRRIREEAEKNKRDAQRVDRKTEREKHIEKLAVSISEIKHQLQQYTADDQSHKKGERRRNLWEIAMLATAAGVGAVAIIVGSYDSHEQRSVMTEQARAMREQLAKTDETLALLKSQTDTMRGQLAVAETDQRPWLQFIPKKADALTILDPDTLKFGINFEIINTGKTPARDIGYWVDLSTANIDSLKKASDTGERCRLAEVTQSNIAGPTTLFPNDNGNREFWYSWSAPASGFYQKWGEVENAPTYVIAVVDGCITYHSMHSDVVHHTWFAFDLRRINDKGEGAQISPGNQSIPGAEIRVRYSMFKTSGAD